MGVDAETPQQRVVGLTEEQRRRRLRAFGAEIIDDTPESIAWLRRGPLVTSRLLPLFVRRWLLRIGGVRIGQMVTGLVDSFFMSPNVSIGDGAFLNFGVRVEGTGAVSIGRDVMVGPQVLFITSHHEIGSDRQMARRVHSRDTVIEDGAAIGARAVLFPGVTVGAGTLVGAGAVVLRDCEPGALYAGVPATRVQVRSDIANHRSVDRTRRPGPPVDMDSRGDGNT